MAAEIAPAITVETVDDYKAAVDRIHTFANRVHVDLSDGEFAPSFLIPTGQLWWPPEWRVDIHAMVAYPSQHVLALMNLKPNLIIFHAESKEDILPVINQIKQAGISAGVALLKTTVPDTIKEIIAAVDHVMIFSGDLGHYGGTASMMQLEKIRLIKKINPKVEIGWDGGVTIENAYTLTQGGVNVLNTGGAIAKAEDPAATYEAMVKEINKHGII